MLGQVTNAAQNKTTSGAIGMKLNFTQNNQVQSVAATGNGGPVTRQRTAVGLALLRRSTNAHVKAKVALRKHALIEKWTPVQLYTALEAYKRNQESFAQDPALQACQDEMTSSGRAVSADKAI